MGCSQSGNIVISEKSPLTNGKVKVQNGDYFLDVKRYSDKLYEKPQKGFECFFLNQLQKQEDSCKKRFSAGIKKHKNSKQSKRISNHDDRNAQNSMAKTNDQTLINQSGLQNAFQLKLKNSQIYLNGDLKFSPLLINQESKLYPKSQNNLNFEDLQKKIDLKYKVKRISSRNDQNQFEINRNIQPSHQNSVANQDFMQDCDIDNSTSTQIVQNLLNYDQSDISQFLPSNSQNLKIQSLENESHLNNQSDTQQSLNIQQNEKVVQNDFDINNNLLQVQEPIIPVSQDTQKLSWFQQQQQTPTNLIYGDQNSIENKENYQSQFHEINKLYQLKTRAQPGIYGAVDEKISNDLMTSIRIQQLEKSIRSYIFTDHEFTTPKRDSEIGDAYLSEDVENMIENELKNNNPTNQYNNSKVLCL
eukprot:403343605